MPFHTHGQNNSHHHGQSNSHHHRHYPSHHVHHTHYPYSQGYGFGHNRVFVSRGGSLAGFTITATVLVAAFILFSLVTNPIAVSGLTASAGGSTLFSAATLGFGALALYTAAGLAYLYSGAKEAYHTNKGIFEILNSRVNNEHGLSFKGIFSTIGAVLWSPFLLIGAASGKAVKTIVTASHQQKSYKDELIPLQDFPLNKTSSSLSRLGKKVSNNDIVEEKSYSSEILSTDNTKANRSLVSHQNVTEEKGIMLN